MPRQSRGRPAARPAAPPPTQQQSRGAHTAAAPASGYSSVPQARPAAPAATTQAGAPAQQGPGMMAQMAATAGSVAIGSTIGHGLSSMLFGGSSNATAPAAEAPVAQQPYQSQSQAPSCEIQARDFTTCLEKADMQSCSWYLEQLKACQAAARPY